MLRLEFTTEAIEALRYERFHHPHPRVQLKMEVLLLKSQQLPHWQICQVAGVSGNTLRTYLRDYQAGGIAQLQQLNFYQPQSALQAHVESLEAHFKEHPPVSAKQARAFIADQTGIERSLTQIRAFLLRLGVKCRKVGTIPARADVEKQAQFLHEQLEPRLAEAQAGQRQVYFMDSAHFVLETISKLILTAICCSYRVYLILPASGLLSFFAYTIISPRAHPSRSGRYPRIEGQAESQF